MKFSAILSITLLQAPGLLASGVPRKEGSLFARDCWFGEKVGCGEGGWCWKTCDSVAGTWVSLFLCNTIPLYTGHDCEDMVLTKSSAGPPMIRRNAAAAASGFLAPAIATAAPTLREGSRIERYLVFC